MQTVRDVDVEDDGALDRTKLRARWDAGLDMLLLVNVDDEQECRAAPSVTCQTTTPRNPPIPPTWLFFLAFLPDPSLGTRNRFWTQLGAVGIFNTVQ